jgi:23S rRNA pseudouridine2605 synthase
VSAERLQKFLANAGVASRRGAEELILRGVVAVDGVTIKELGTKVDPEKQIVTVKGKEIRQGKRVVYALNKPKGVISTRVAQDKTDKIVTDLVPKSPAVYPVGRLDADSEGLILITNDGKLTDTLTHPSFNHTKEYCVDVRYTGEKPELSLEKLTERLFKGVKLSDGKLLPDAVNVTPSPLGQDMRRVEITIHEGRNHVLRRAMSTLDYKVVKLRRTAIGRLTLAGLKPGQWRILTEREIAKAMAGAPKRTSEEVLEGDAA